MSAQSGLLRVVAGASPGASHAKHLRGKSVHRTLPGLARYLVSDDAISSEDGPHGKRDLHENLRREPQTGRCLTYRYDQDGWEVTARHCYLGRDERPDSYEFWLRRDFGDIHVSKAMHRFLFRGIEQLPTAGVRIKGPEGSCRLYEELGRLHINYMPAQGVSVMGADLYNSDPRYSVAALEPGIIALLVKLKSRLVK